MIMTAIRRRRSSSSQLRSFSHSSASFSFMPAARQERLSRTSNFLFLLTQIAVMTFCVRGSAIFTERLGDIEQLLMMQNGKILVPFGEALEPVTGKIHWHFAVYIEHGKSSARFPSIKIVIGAYG